MTRNRRAGADLIHLRLTVLSAPRPWHRSSPIRWQPELPLAFQPLHHSALSPARIYLHSAPAGPRPRNTDTNNIAHAAWRLRKHSRRTRRPTSIRRCSSPRNRRIASVIRPTAAIAAPSRRRAACSTITALDPAVDDRPDRQFPFVTGPCDTSAYWRHCELVQRLRLLPTSRWNRSGRT